MLTELEAKRIGVRACIEKIGYDFCMQNEENSSTTYGAENGIMFCFVGIDTPNYDNEDPNVLILSSMKGFQYHASCNVNMQDGNIEFLDFEAYSH